MMMLLWVCLKRQTIISAFIILSEALKTPRSVLLESTSSMLFSITFMLVYSWRVSFFRLGIDRKGVMVIHLLWLDLHWPRFKWRYVIIGLFRVLRFSTHIFFNRLRRFYLLLKALRVQFPPGGSMPVLFLPTIFRSIVISLAATLRLYLIASLVFVSFFFPKKKRRTKY